MDLLQPVRDVNTLEITSIIIVKIVCVQMHHFIPISIS